MEVKHKFLNFSNKVIYQNTDYFSFSLDSLLLANFVTINLKDKKIIDLACGNAPIPMLLTYRTNAIIYGVELQKEIYELAVKSVKENNFQNRIILLNDDVKNIKKNFESDTFDIVTCNPPYFPGNVIVNDNDVKSIARHELKLTLDDVLATSRKILKNGGVLAMVHRPNRLVEIILKMKEYNIEPKKICFVYPYKGKEANILLIEGAKNGNSGLKILDPIIIYNEDGSYTDEIVKMFKEE